MLHVTNGDATLVELERAGLEGGFLAWRDALHEGPVPPLPPDELRAVRARFLSRGHADERDAAADMERRDARLAQALQAREPVALWFEHDLYDQLQLIQILDRADRVALCGFNRWIGGLALVASERLWRWDGARRAPVLTR